MKKIRSVGFFVNTTKENAASVVEGVCTWLEARGIVPLLPDEQAAALAENSRNMYLQNGGRRTSGCDSRPWWRWHAPKRSTHAE